MVLEHMICTQCERRFSNQLHLGKQWHLTLAAESLYVIVIIMALTVTHEVEVKTEADSNDITEHPHDDKPTPHLCTVCDKRSNVQKLPVTHTLLTTYIDVFSVRNMKRILEAVII